MKEIYTKPVAEVTEFQQMDILTSVSKIEQMNPGTSDGWF
jgi:hypothetical protein